MQIETLAIVTAARQHSEHGVVARLLTPEHGLLAGYVRGGHSSRLRPVLIPGNIVQAYFHARVGTQLPALTVEIVRARAALLVEPIAALAVEWTTALVAATLPEAQVYPKVHAALDGVLHAIESATAARDWIGALARFELVMLAELGFGLDLSHCAATGATADLAYVSPKTGVAVSAAAGAAHASRLLPLPGFILTGDGASGRDALDGLALSGFFIARHLLIGRAAELLPARERLVERIARAVA